MKEVLTFGLIALLSTATPGIILYFYGVYRWKSWLWFKSKKK